MLDHLQRAAELGWQPSQRELQFLAHDTCMDWAALRRRVDLSAWLALPTVRVVSESPRIRVFERFAATDECDWLIGPARHCLRRARVYRKDPARYAEADTRTNTDADYTIVHADIVLRLLIERLATAAAVAPRFFEVAKLLDYTPGQLFAPHCDFQDSSTPALAEVVRQRGQKVMTALLYLNDDYEGGETEFPRIGFRYKAKRGDALLFANVHTSGALDYDTLHAGLPPARGEKWVPAQWVRNRPVSPE